MRPLLIAMLACLASAACDNFAPQITDPGYACGLAVDRVVPWSSEEAPRAERMFVRCLESAERRAQAQACPPCPPCAATPDAGAP